MNAYNTATLKQSWFLLLKLRGTGGFIQSHLCPDTMSPPSPLSSPQPEGIEQKRSHIAPLRPPPGGNNEEQHGTLRRGMPQRKLPKGTALSPSTILRSQLVINRIKLIIRTLFNLLPIHSENTGIFIQPIPIKHITSPPFYLYV
jgi:hypothetical protein